MGCSKVYPLGDKFYDKKLATYHGHTGFNFADRGLKNFQKFVYVKAFNVTQSKIMNERLSSICGCMMLADGAGLLCLRVN
jgi:hypothetical protein